MEAAVGTPTPAPTGAAPPATTSWADAVAFSAAQSGEPAPAVPVITTRSVVPAVATPEPEVEAAPEVKLTPERVAAVLRNFGKPVTLDAIVVELMQTRAEGEAYMSGGVVHTVLDALIATGGAVKSSAGTPPIDHYALAEEAQTTGAPVEPTPAPEPVTAHAVLAGARAAVVAALATERTYPVGGPHAGPPEIVAGGALDTFQVAYIVHVAQVEAIAPIALGAAFVEALTEGIGRDDMAGLEARITGHLTALHETGYLTTVTLPPRVRAPEAASEGEVEGEVADAEPDTRTLYMLSPEGRALYQARGALGVAEATLPPEPKGPSVEDQVAGALAPLKKELATTVEERSLAIVQRDTALFAQTRAEDTVANYQRWFLSRGVEQPDFSADARPARKVIKEYAIDIVLDEEQHWRILGEWTDAKTALGETEALATEAKSSWKAKLELAQGLVTRLEALSVLRPGTRHCLVKAVYKEVRDGAVHVFSADDHDYGTFILAEPIPVGSQRTFPGTIAEEVAPTKKGKAKATTPLAGVDPVALGKRLTETLGGTASVEGGTLTVTLHASDLSGASDPSPDSDAGRVLGFLRTKGNSSEERMAEKLGLDLPKLVAALGALGAKVEKDGSVWTAVKAPPAIVLEDKPKADGSQELGLTAVRAGVQKMFATEPVSRTGLLYGAIVSTYLTRHGITSTPSTEKWITLAVDGMLRDGVLAEGEGGGDRLVWDALLEDPRLTDADRKQDLAGLSEPVLTAAPTMKVPGEDDEGLHDETEEDDEEETGEEAEDAADGPASSKPAAAAPKAKKTAAKKAAAPKAKAVKGGGGRAKKARA